MYGHFIHDPSHNPIHHARRFEQALLALTLANTHTYTNMYGLDRIRNEKKKEKQNKNGKQNVIREKGVSNASFLSIKHQHMPHTCRGREIN